MNANNTLKSFLILIITSMSSSIFAQQISWETLKDIPQPHMSGEAVVCEGKIHLVGGRKKSGENERYHYVYDPATDAWADKENLKIGRANIAVASVGGKVYAFGGDKFRPA